MTNSIQCVQCLFFTRKHLRAALYECTITSWHYHSTFSQALFACAQTESNQSKGSQQQRCWKRHQRNNVYTQRVAAAAFSLTNQAELLLLLVIDGAWTKFCTVHTLWPWKHHQAFKFPSRWEVVSEPFPVSWRCTWPQKDKLPSSSLTWSCFLKGFVSFLWVLHLKIQ